jgi:hypothetical protein
LSNICTVSVLLGRQCNLGTVCASTVKPSVRTFVVVVVISSAFRKCPVDVQQSGVVNRESMSYIAIPLGLEA